MVQNQSQVDDDREITRRVLGDMSAAWEQPWREALEYQERNPDVLERALDAPEDFGEAAKAMVPYFAMLHPTILRTAILHCQAVADEFALGGDVLVSPSRDTPQVVSEHMFGGGQQETRAVDELQELRRLREENAELRAHMKQLLADHEFDREVLRAIQANANLALERDAG